MADILDNPIQRAGAAAPAAPPPGSAGAPATTPTGLKDILDNPIQRTPAPVQPKLNAPAPSPVAPTLPASPLPIPPTPTGVQTSTPAFGAGSTFSNVLDGLKAIPGLAVDAFTAVPKALLEAEIHPSADEQAFEAQATSHPTTTFGKIVQALPNAATAAVFRFFQPAIQPVADSLASSASALLDQYNAGGTIPWSKLQETYPALQKSGLQVFGDTVIAGLTVAMPELGVEGVGAAATKTGIQALRAGATSGATAGGLFATAQVLSSGTTDPKEIAKIYADNIVGGAILGGVTHATVPLAGEAFAKATKDIQTKYGLPQHIFIDATKIRDIFQTGTLATEQENELIRSLGLTGEQYRTAIKEGLSIEIPAQNITTITDKPYWEAIKDSFGFKPTNKTIAASPTPQFSDRILNPERQLPSPQDVRAELDSGKTPDHVAYGLQKDMPKEDAEALVKQAQELPQGEQAPAPTAQVPTELPSSVDESALNKTPGDYQQDFASVQVAHDSRIDELQASVKDLETRVAGAPAQSAEKKSLKVELSNVKDQLKTAQESHDDSIVTHAGALSSAVQGHLENTHGVEPAHSRELAAKVISHITEPNEHENTSLKEIAARVATEHHEATSLRRGDVVTVAEGKGMVVRPARMPDGKPGYTVQTTNAKGDAVHKDYPKSAIEKGKTQKEIVKEAVAKKGTAKAGDIAKETKILEPNVRQILGLGEKAGEFERVDKGVYRVKTADGKDAAFVIPGDALTVLPQLVKDGFRADMVFLDIPYKTKALLGGNRGIKDYDLISPAEFNRILIAVNKIVKGDESSVFYMFSQAKSGEKEMSVYTDLFMHYGFKPVARGEWTKLFQNGKLATNPRGKPAAPEGIILFNKTGKMPEGKATPNLAFQLVRPKGYQTEKPAEMIKALIEMSTKEGETVLDPFAGSGVTAEQAVKTKRKAVAIEKNPEQAKKIAERVEKAAGELKLGDAVTIDTIAGREDGKISSLSDNGENATVKTKTGNYSLETKNITRRGETTPANKEAPKHEYRGAHQLSEGEPASSLTDLDEIVKQLKVRNGYLTNYDLTDLKKLKTMQGKPDMEVKIYRAAPKNELNSGDWVTTSHVYASDIKKQNGGQIHTFTVKASELHYPTDLRELPSLARFSAFKYISPAKAEEEKPPSKDFSSVPENKQPEKVPRSPKEKKESEAEASKEEPKKSLDSRELYNAEKAIEQNRPRGYAGTVFKEVATWFNPRGQAQTPAVDAIMRNKGEYERTLFRTERAMKEVKKMWDAHSQDTSLDFMDKVETGDTASLPPEFKALAEMYRERLTNAYNAIQEFKDVPFLENYFPHLWKDPEAVRAANVWAKANAKRPLQGNKSFTKHRIFATIKDGIKAGYELETHNPEELMQLHEQNIQKFLMANKIMADLKERGFSKLVKAGGKAKIPDGFDRLNDNIAKVYMNPNIPILEAYDEEVYNGLADVISSLGLEHDRKYDIGGRGALGFTQKGTDKITTKFGTPLSIIAHELGHQLDYKYGLQELFKADPDRTYGSESDYTQKELRKLADLRYAGHEVTDSYKQYVRSAPEKMAVMLEAYVHAPEKFKEVAPRTFEKFTAFLALHPETKPILDLKPSLVYGTREDSIYAGGLVLGGEYWVQKDVARMLNNYLSPDHIMDTALGKGIMNLKNTMNAFELGFSAFHLTMESLDTMITKFSIGLAKVATGKFSGFGDMAIAPVTPYLYFRAGQKFFNGDPELMKIENDLFTGGASLREKQYYKNTVFDSFMQANREALGQVRRGELLGAGKNVAFNVLRLPMAAIEATMRPLFTYYIPRLKVGAFRDLFATELERNSQRIQDGEMTHESIARDVWNNIENRMGELNYDNLFWNRNLKTGLMLTTRAVGWNLGTVRELGGAFFQDLPKEAFNAARGKGFNFTPKIAYTLSLFFFVATLGAIYQYLHTGKKPGSPKDLFYPQNGATTAAGEPYRIEFPTYLKDIYQSGVPQLLTGKPFGAFDSFSQMLKNKSAPELTTILDIMGNKDFYGNEIRNPHDNAPTQLKQLTLYLLSQFTPFTFQQQQNLASGKSTLEQQVEAFFGIIKAPTAVIQSDFNAQLAAIYQDQNGLRAPQTPEEAEAYAKKQTVVDQIKKGDYSGLQELVNEGIIKPTGIRSFIQNAVLSTPQKQYKYLSGENKAKLIQGTQ